MPGETRQQATWDDFERELRQKISHATEAPIGRDEASSHSTHALPLPGASVFFIGLFTGVIGARVACACTIR